VQAHPASPVSPSGPQGRRRRRPHQRVRRGAASGWWSHLTLRDLAPGRQALRSALDLMQQAMTHRTHHLSCAASGARFPVGSVRRMRKERAEPTGPDAFLCIARSGLARRRFGTGRTRGTSASLSRSSAAIASSRRETPAGSQTLGRPHVRREGETVTHQDIPIGIAGSEADCGTCRITRGVTKHGFFRRPQADRRRR